jgi:hypothetical protein
VLSTGLHTFPYSTLLLRRVNSYPRSAAPRRGVLPTRHNQHSTRQRGPRVLAVIVYGLNGQERHSMGSNLPRSSNRRELCQTIRSLRKRYSLTRGSRLAAAALPAALRRSRSDNAARRAKRRALQAPRAIGCSPWTSLVGACAMRRIASTWSLGGAGARALRVPLVARALERSGRVGLLGAVSVVGGQRKTQSGWGCVRRGQARVFN